MVPVPIPLPARSQINGYLLKIWAFRSDDTAARRRHRIIKRSNNGEETSSSYLISQFSSSAFTCLGTPLLLALLFMAKIEALNKYGRTNGQSGSQFNLSNCQWRQERGGGGAEGGSVVGFASFHLKRICPLMLYK